MSSSTRFTLALSVIVACLTAQSDAFVPGTSSRTPMTALQAESSSDAAVTSRRNALFGIIGTVGAVMAGSPADASASYSAYTHREQDWEERKTKGEVTFKTAKDLRAELREIAPMNSEGSKIFCPNGPSSAVSPLMENKCGDRMAIPSVYGRTKDVVGNSIPGFSTASGFSSASLDNTGGFPAYK